MGRMLPAPLALLLLVMLSLGSALMLLGLNVNNAPEIYFPASAPAVQFEQELRERFPHDQVIVAMFEPPDPYADDFIAAMEQAVESLQRDPQVDRVISPVTADQIRGSEDGFVVEPLLALDTVAGLSSAERRARVLEDRFAPGLLASTDGAALALILRPKKLENSYQRHTLERTFLRAVEEAGLAPHMSALSGIIPLEVAQLRSMIRDSMMFIPATLAIGLGLIAWLFRRWLAVLTAALTIGATVNTTVALLILSGQPYTMISAILPPLMSALTVAFLIHWYSALTHAASRGFSGRERVERAMDVIAKPALYSALTTAAGLLSLAFSPTRPVMAFGIVSAAGMMVLCAVVLFLLPPIFARWDRRDWAARGAGIHGFDAMVASLRGVGMRHPLWVLGLATLLLVVCVAQFPRIAVETDLFRFFKSDHPITVSTERIQERLSGVTTLELVLDAGERDVFKDPRVLVALQDLQRWVEALPEVDRAISMADLMEQMHWGFHEEDPAYRRLPGDPDLVSQYLLIYDGVDLHELVDRDFERTRIVLNLNVHGARAINDVIARIEAEAAALPDGIGLTVAGFGRLFGDQEALLIEGQVRGLFVALALIFALMALEWRSLRASALCMIPNMAPVVLIFGAMAVFGVWLDMATAMVASVTVGIAVDDTIHVYHGYQRRIRAGVSRVWALARSYQHAGRAVSATTVILGGQFLLLGASQFVPTVEFGLLTAFGLTVALFFDLLVLPALLIVLAPGFWMSLRGGNSAGG